MDINQMFLADAIRIQADMLTMPISVGPYTIRTERTIVSNCEYCGTQVHGTRCDSCGAPNRVPVKPEPPKGKFVY